MDDFSRLAKKLKMRSILLNFIVCATIIFLGWASITYLSISGIYIVMALLFVSAVASVILAIMTTEIAILPLKMLWQAIIHVSAVSSTTPPPNIEKLHYGRELINDLALQIYQLASRETGKEIVEHRSHVIQATSVLSHLPLPLFVFNKNQQVINASENALEYCRTTSADLFGKPLYESLNMEFSNNNTLEKWINDCANNKVTDTAYWERVRVLPKDGTAIRQCDIAAFYSRDNPSGAEYIVTLYDRTEQYNADDQSLTFVALAVHELRTPLTILRGYVEVFEEDFAHSLDPEMKSFMYKMRVASNQLSAFVHNILNVARIEQNQMVMHLGEENWALLLPKLCEDQELRAKVHGIALEYDIADNLPTVGVDKVSVHEVLNNLIDNAIKYSGLANKILISAKLGRDGSVETTVTDYGLGMPASVIPNLFEKFYRNHRTKSTITGTGLGLFLCKSIVNAHGGQIWAESKEGQGSTFGFTLQPYSQLAETEKNGNNSDITRNAHGWIKNHSIYRR